jgi:hypothetical protein
VRHAPPTRCAAPLRRPRPSSHVPAGGGAASLLSSLDVIGRNTQLVAYIDANAMMLLDFLRVTIASRHATFDDKAVALHALHQLLRVLEADGSVPQWWWGEMVATLTHALKQPALQAQALAVIRTFVPLLQVNGRRSSLSLLLLLLLWRTHRACRCLSHTRRKHVRSAAAEQRTARVASPVGV